MKHENNKNIEKQRQTNDNDNKPTRIIQEDSDDDDDYVIDYKQVISYSSDDDNDDKNTNVKPDDYCQIDEVNENKYQIVRSINNNDCKKDKGEDATISPTVSRSPSSAYPKDAEKLMKRIN